MHSRHQLAETKLRLCLFQPIALTMLHLMHQRGAANERLAWHAAVIQAVASHLVRFDQRDFCFHYRGDIRTDQTRRTGADYDQIAIKLCGTLPARIYAAAFYVVQEALGDPRKYTEQRK